MEPGNLDLNFPYHIIRTDVDHDPFQRYASQWWFNRINITGRAFYEVNQEHKIVSYLYVNRLKVAKSLSTITNTVHVLAGPKILLPFLSGN
jgi:hypothetical protein